MLNMEFCFVTSGKLFLCNAHAYWQQCTWIHLCGNAKYIWMALLKDKMELQLKMSARSTV